MENKMKRILLLIAVFTFSNVALSATQYFNGKIERVEVCTSNGGTVYIYFKNIVGTTPIATNGCSNDIAIPYVRLNNNIGSLTEFEKATLSTVLAAQAADRSLRVRYSDQSMFLESIAVD